jgi:hypothetical protein
VWKARELLKKKEDVHIIHGGKERGKDYNHSTFIDGVLRGLCGVEIFGTNLEINPKIKGIWKWFKIENLTFRKNTYNVYYDEDGTVFGKGKGVIIEEK